jgi:hypothetical protein
MPVDDPTPSEAYLMRLLNFESLHDLNLFLSTPDDLGAINGLETPDEFYEEIAQAEEEREQVEALERLYALPSTNRND